MSSLSHKQQVLAIIRKYPQAANDDAYLLDRYYHEVEDWQDDKSFYWNMSRSTPSESITRIRRKLYNEGLINYDESTLKAREKRFIEERDTYSLSEVFGFNTEFIERVRKDY